MNTKHGIQPTEDRILLTLEKGEEKTAGGIFIPKEAQEKPQIGRILAIGEGTKEKPMNFKVNQRVLFSQYGGNKIKYNGEDYIILSTSDILAILT